MFVCTYVCMSVYLYMCGYGCVHMYVLCLYVCVHEYGSIVISVSIYVSIHVCMSISTHVCRYLCISVHMYLFTYGCLYLYVCVYLSVHCISIPVCILAVKNLGNRAGKSWVKDSPIIIV